MYLKWTICFVLLATTGSTLATKGDNRIPIKNKRTLSGSSLKAFQKLERIVKDVEKAVDGAYDAIAEGKNAAATIGTIKHRISEAWVIIRTFDEANGELRVSSLPLIKALQSAAKDLEIMSDGKDRSRVSEDVEAVLKSQERAQAREALKLIDIAEELIAKNEEINAQAYLVGHHGHVESPPRAVSKLVAMKRRLVALIRGEDPARSDDDFDMIGDVLGRHDETTEHLLEKKPAMRSAADEFRSTWHPHETEQQIARDLEGAYAAEGTAGPL